MEEPSSRPAENRPVKILAKMTEIVDLLAAGEPLGAAEIAARIGEPRSSVYRLLRTLRELGYVESRRRGQFQLGMRLFELGSDVAARFNLRDAARGPMERLHEATGETVLLFVPRGEVAVCAARLDGRWVRLEIVDIGGTLPLHTGASPRLLLACSAPDLIDRYLETTPLEATTDRSPTTPRRVRELLAEIREAGYAVSDGDLVPGVASVAVGVRDKDGEIVAAISLSGLAETLVAPAELDRTVALVRETAREASRQLGWSAAPTAARGAGDGR